MWEISIELYSYVFTIMNEPQYKKYSYSSASVFYNVACDFRPGSVAYESSAQVSLRCVSTIIMQYVTELWDTYNLHTSKIIRIQLPLLL